jgi:hypothetical protein
LANVFSSVLTEEDVNNLPKMNIRKNTTKSPGPDRAHPKILFELSSVIDKPLYLIFKKSFETGIVPDSWKHYSRMEIRNLRQITDQSV